MLEPLEQSQRARLVAAMDEVERLMRASLVTIAVADPASADARWCIEQYFAELGDRFEDGFDPAISIAAPIDELKPPTGLLLVAHLRRAAGGLRGAQDPPGPAGRAEADVGITRGARPRPRPAGCCGSSSGTRRRPAPTPFASRRTGR